MNYLTCMHQDDKDISYYWMRGFAAGVTAYENYFLDNLASDGVLNTDYSGADILDPTKSNKVRLSLLRIVRRIMSERAAAAWGVRRGRDKIK